MCTCASVRERAPHSHCHVEQTPHILCCGMCMGPNCVLKSGVSADNSMQAMSPLLGLHDALLTKITLCTTAHCTAPWHRFAPRMHPVFLLGQTCKRFAALVNMESLWEDMLSRDFHDQRARQITRGSQLSKAQYRRLFFTAAWSRVFQAQRVHHNQLMSGTLPKGPRRCITARMSCGPAGQSKIKKGPVNKPATRLSVRNTPACTPGRTPGLTSPSPSYSVDDDKADPRLPHA